MAEFREVMKQWKRFCKSHNHCGECEFDGKGICSEAHLSDVPYADIELRIMAWAAEHPEPVFPTWGEWLISVGAARKIPTGVPFELQDGEIVDSPWDTVVDVYTPIPADIAQKLGIEPKEG